MAIIKTIGENGAHLLLPNGNSIRRANIIAVRRGDYSNAADHISEIQWRVIIDYGDAGEPGTLNHHVNTIIVWCGSREERDETALLIQNAL